tara:strand:+ start:253 stop:477 length:225 start_codon:yes stop_codon:yes gene_type:complete
MKKNKKRSHLRLICPTDKPQQPRKPFFVRIKEWLHSREGQVAETARKISYIGILISLGVFFTLTVVYVAIMRQL